MARMARRETLSPAPAGHPAERLRMAAINQAHPFLTAAQPRFGVFLPSGNGAFTMSTSPNRTIVPTWEFVRQVSLFAEQAGFDFLLAGARWTTLGGKMDFQGCRFESMTLITALAAVTRRVMLFPTIHTFVFHPVLAARMVNDANRISGGRCGLNVVSGWVKTDFDVFGVPQRPPDERLAYNTEWLNVLKNAWTQPNFDSAGDHFTVRNSYLEPKPSPLPPICKAGDSEQSRDLVSRHGDLLFITLPPDPARLRTKIADLKAAAAAHGRSVRVLSYAFVLTRPERSEAFAVRDEILAAGQREPAFTMARQWLGREPESADRGFIENIILSLNTRAFIGTPPDVSAELREFLDAGLDGLLFTVYDYERDLVSLAETVLPRLRD